MAHQSTSIERVEHDEFRQRLVVKLIDDLASVHIGVPSGVHAAFLPALHRSAFCVEQISRVYRLSRGGRRCRCRP